MLRALRWMPSLPPGIAKRADGGGTVERAHLLEGEARVGDDQVEVEVDGARSPSLRPHASQASLDELQIPQQPARLEAGLDLGDGVEEVGLLRVPHRRGVVERRHLLEARLGIVHEHEHRVGVRHQRSQLLDGHPLADERPRAPAVARVPRRASRCSP